MLDLTRIIAGPVATRALAAHGAEVLLVTAAHLPSIAPLVVDTGRGKRSTSLRPAHAARRAALHALVREADVIVHGYRPGGLDALGFDAATLARERPGLVVASLSAYGTQGPWAQRRGFDSLVQTASGFNVAEAQAAGDASRPRVLPAQALDHASGYLLALGAMQALRRRAREGGSWQVRSRWRAPGCGCAACRGCPTASRRTTPAFEDFADLLEAERFAVRPPDRRAPRRPAVAHAAALDAAGRALGSDAPLWL